MCTSIIHNGNKTFLRLREIVSSIRGWAMTDMKRRFPCWRMRMKDLMWQIALEY